MRPWRTRLFSTILVMNNLVALGLLAVVWRAGHWMTVLTSAEFADQAARADRWINLSLELTVLIIGGITLFETLRELGQMFTGRREARA